MEEAIELPQCPFSGRKSIPTNDLNGGRNFRMSLLGYGSFEAIVDECVNHKFDYYNRSQMS